MERDESYEIQPAPLGRSSRRRASAVLASAVLMLCLVVVKPWAGPAAQDVPSAPPTSVGAEATAGLTLPSDASVAKPLAIPSQPEPGWPATAGSAGTTAASATQAIAGLESLSIYSGA